VLLGEVAPPEASEIRSQNSCASSWKQRLITDCVPTVLIAPAIAMS